MLMPGEAKDHIEAGRGDRSSRSVSVNLGSEADVVELLADEVATTDLCKQLGMVLLAKLLHLSGDRGRERTQTCEGLEAKVTRRHQQHPSRLNRSGNRETWVREEAREKGGVERAGIRRTACGP